MRLAQDMQSLFASQAMRVNTTTDVVGVEICGALKNVLAIAAGIVEGLQLGHNAMAALISQVGRLLTMVPFARGGIACQTRPGRFCAIEHEAAWRTSINVPPWSSPSAGSSGFLLTISQQHQLSRTAAWRLSAELRSSSQAMGRLDQVHL